MEKFEIGDLVVLTAGSMRMAVEAVDDGRVHCVWAHEGKVGRDSFPPALLKRWETREHEPRPARGGEFRSGGDFRGGGDDGDAPRRGPKPFAKPFAGPASPGPRKPRPKPTGWDGKPREKKFFRKD
jgi:uncharacterized protein YodC (DUF2158 family)